MKKPFIFVLLSFLVFLLIGCPPPKITCPQGPEGKEVILPKCEKLIKYDSVNLTLPNLSIPIPAIGTTVTVGSGTWKKEQLQKASDAALALDDGNYLVCNALPSRMSVCKNDAECYQVITDHYNNIIKEQQFIECLKSNNPKALDWWLATYYKKEVKVIGKDKAKDIGKAKDIMVEAEYKIDKDKNKDVITTYEYVLKENVKARPLSTF